MKHISLLLLLVAFVGCGGQELSTQDEAGETNSVVPEGGGEPVLTEEGP